MIFLAIPYTDDDPKMIDQRVAEGEKAVVLLQNKGYSVYCPVVFFHHLGKKHGMPLTWEHWEFQCKHMIGKADKVIVLRLPRWDKSVGVKGEMRTANKLNIPVFVYTLEELKRHI